MSTLSELSGGLSKLNKATGRSATYVIAASDAPAHVKAQADVTENGTNTQTLVNTAIVAGYKDIQLTEGTFNIYSTGGAGKGGIEIPTGTTDLWLHGSGWGTKLYLADNQQVNVIKVAGGASRILISDLAIDGNVANNPNLLNFEQCGIRAGNSGNIVYHVTVKKCKVLNTTSLNIMLQGGYVYARECLVNANNSDSIELLSGPGGIYDCVLSISGADGVVGSYGLSIDAGNYIEIAHNLITISNAGTLGYAFRTWTDSGRNTIRDNYIYKSADSTLNYCVDLKGISDTFENNWISANAETSIALVRETATDALIKDNRGLKLITNLGSRTNIIGNFNYIAPGETRSASGALTAGNANAIAFAWHDPEIQDIYIKKVVITVTTPGGTVGSHLDVGIADDAAGTNRGTEFFDDLLLNTAQVNDSTLVADGGTQSKWVFCQDSASATDGWVVGQILDANATNLVGSYYIEYVGK
jgi:hypothetical protein